MVTTTSRIETGICYIDADLIRVNQKKLRKLSQAKISQYLRDFERGDAFPPIEVENCGGFYTIRDGRHRFQAQLLCGYRLVTVTVM